MPVGFVRRAHGVRGSLLVQPFNQDSEGLEQATALWLAPRGGPLEAARRYQVDRAERVNLGYIVALRGVDGKDAADGLKGCEVLVSRDELPELEAGEIYAADMVGMAVVDGQGVPRGEVVGFEFAGANELLRVGKDGKETLVPFGLLREVDGTARRIVIEAPEGLFDEQLS